MKYLFPIGLFVLILLNGCIGNDYLDDRVEPRLKITNSLKSIAKDTSLFLEYLFTNNIGLNEEIVVDWSSTNPEIASINALGELSALNKGTTIIGLDAIYEGQALRDTFHLTVSDETVENPTGDERTGELIASSFYDLEGSFTLKKENDLLILKFSDDYNADTGLPGLYVYLTNNPNSVNGAYIIGPVEVFSGEHSYEIEDNIDLFEYSHVLYFCKPFNVKVGDGSLSE